MDSKSPRHRFSTLGPIELTSADGHSVRSVLAQPKRIALLAYLRIANGGEPVTRDSVLGVLWPEIPEERALNSLRQGIHFIRRSLGSSAVERTGDHLLWIPPEELWCDAVEFTRRVAGGDPEGAMTLYRGSFLDGIPLDGPHDLEDWVDRTRRQLRRNAIQCATELSERARGAGQAVTAADWARRAIEIDPLDERATAMLVEAHAAAGDTVAAVRAFDRYAERLALELDLEPSDTLRGRIDELRGADGESRSAVSVDSSPDAPRPTGEDASSMNPPPDGDAASISAPPARATPTRPEKRRPLVGWQAVTFLAAVVMASTAIAYLRGRGEPAAAPGPATAGLIDEATEARPSVAVLPFSNLSPDSANSFFVSGVHESVLVTLSKIRALDVSGLQAVRGYAGSTTPLRQIAEDLRVSTILSGSVQRDVDRVRIIVELVDARQGIQLWSEAYDHELDDIFGVQAEIATSVARALRAVLTPDEATRIARRATEDLDALDNFMRGREAYRELSLARMDEAIEYYELAAAADPSFAPAWAGIADALLQRVQFFGYPLVWADSAAVLVDRALALDPELPEAHKTVGFVHSVYGREVDALAATQRAIDLRPAYADALNNAGWSYYALGDLPASERLIRHAFRLEPTVAGLQSNVGATWAALGRVDEAGPWLDEVLREHPRLTAARMWRVFVDLQRGDPDAALSRSMRYLADEDAAGPAHARIAFAALLARDFDLARMHALAAVDASPDVDLLDFRRVETVLGYALIRTGSQAEGARWLRQGTAEVHRRVANGADGWDPPWELAAAVAASGDIEQALRHLEESVARGFPYATLLRLDPTFDSLRGDRRFDELIMRVEQRSERQRAESVGSGTDG